MDISDWKTLQDFQRAFLEVKAECEQKLGSKIQHVEIFHDNDVRIQFSSKG